VLIYFPITRILKMRKEVQIALLAVLVSIVAIWGFKFLSGQNLFGGAKTYYTIVHNAKQINTATKILINGYQVGTVISIAPEPDDIRNIKIGFQVEKHIKLPNYTTVELRNEGPMGGKEIELIFDKFCDGTNCAENGVILQSETIGLFGSIITPEELDPHIESITSSIDHTLGKLGAPESNAPLDKTIRNLSATMDNLANSTSRFSNLMDKSSRDLEVTLNNMAILTEALVGSNAKLSAILNDVGTLTNDLSKISLSETVNKSNSTIDQAGASLKALETTMTEATVMVKDLNKILVAMDSDDGTLGLLLNDKKLYTDLEATMTNMNLLLQDIRLNPRRYLKVFGKKVPDYEFPSADPASGQ